MVLIITGCAKHQDLLAPQYPGQKEPVNHSWEKPKEETDK